MPLFEVAILERPTKKEAEDGAIERLVFGPKAVVAADEQLAGIAAVKGEAEGLELNRAEVLVRPFA